MDFTRPKRCPRQPTGREDRHSNFYEIPDNLAFPPALRRAVYTTNQIESLNAVVRKAVRSRGHFPDDESARKLVYLAIRNHESNWKRPMAGWYECLAAFHTHFQDRLTQQS